MIVYEWSIELLDNGDIVDSYFSDKLKDLSRPTESHDLVLVRNEGDEINGVQDRLWAYVKDGKLPELFTDSLGQSVGIKVPAKFHKELWG